jgi:flagellar biosynthesis protein FlhA
MFHNLRQMLSSQSDLVLTLLVVGILILLFTPIPPQLLDILLIANFCFALLVLLLTFYVEKPLDFSTFPSLLLIATLFRLALNVSATRLILSDANAGEVIGAIGTHVVSGNYIIGLIVFLVLIVVQYVVITNGAQRVAEVAARFTLDSMPGKQMSIDADLNAGLINDVQARERRRQIEREGNFYGSMDGASKFVKGDAIASVIIILIDIIGGLAIGIAFMGMDWSSALHTYTLLTIGDGIVTQIPALIISTGTGIIITRAGSDNYLGQEVSKQILAHPKSILLIGIGLLFVLFLPGMPTFPVLLMLAVVSALAFIAYRAQRIRTENTQPNSPQEPDERDVYGTLNLDPVVVSVGRDLVSIVGDENRVFMDRIVAFRRQYASDIGFVIPKVRVKDDKSLNPSSYKILIYGIKVGQGDIYTDKILAINPGTVKDKFDGIPTTDPTYNLPAVWIDANQKNRARDAGYTIVEPWAVLFTHLCETIKQHSADLLTRSEAELLISLAREQNAGLLDELLPNIFTISDIQKVLQRLLSEKVSIRNLPRILETLVDAGRHNKDHDLVTEVVRQRLGAEICQGLANEDGALFVLTFDPSIEQSLTANIRGDQSQKSFVIDPKFAEQVIGRLAAHVEKMMSANLRPILLCSPEIRRHIRSFTIRVIPHLSVLSLSEIPNNISLKSYGMVSI